jgi:hypothetical protein
MEYCRRRVTSAASGGIDSAGIYVGQQMACSSLACQRDVLPGPGLTQLAWLTKACRKSWHLPHSNTSLLMYMSELLFVPTPCRLPTGWPSWVVEI